MKLKKVFGVWTCSRADRVRTVNFRRSAELSQEIEEADELMTANDVTTRFDGAVVLAEFDECN